MDGYPAPPTWARELSTVGVTGTNGKTSTVSWVAAALRTADPHAVCITTLGHRVGEEQVDVPADYGGFVQAMELSRARGGCHAAIELTSMALGLGFWRGWPCKVGVLTNFSRDHLDVHGSAEHYLACKAQLFVQLPVGGVAVLNADDPASALLAEVIPDGVRVLRYGCGDQADLRASDIRASWQGTQATLTGHPSLEPLPPTLQLAAIGDIYVYNAMAALLAAHALSVPAEVAAKAIGRAPPPPGRFEVVARSPYAVVDYAHTPDALVRTLAVARQLCQGRLTVVLGAGGEREQGKREPMGKAAAAADRVVITNDNPRQEDTAAIAAALRRPIEGRVELHTWLDRREAIAFALHDARPQDVILVAGKGHETEQVSGTASRAFSDAATIREVLQL